MQKPLRREVVLELSGTALEGELTRPEGCRAWVIFAHGSGSSRKSPRNTYVARALNDAGFGTLLFDLLSASESVDRENVFDISLLSYRLAQATDWLKGRPEAKGLPISYFGASTGAAAALQAAAEFQRDVFAVVSRGGRPDLAMEHLFGVCAPVLLIVGGEDHGVMGLNVEAESRLQRARLAIVPGATHLFEEPGALEEVVRLATAFLSECLERKGGSRHEVA